MLGKLVNFAGTAWPQVKVVGSKAMLLKFTGPAGEEPPPTPQFFGLKATGESRPWSTDVAQAFWRSFIEMFDSGDGAQAAAFVRRYGDPSGKLDAAGTVNTSEWFALRCELGPLTRAWGPAEADGVSRIRHAHVKDAEALLRYQLHSLAAGATVIATDAPGLMLRASDLATYLHLSAASALVRRVPMRRCRECDSWFELHRIDARYCSDTCRAAHHRSGKERSP